MISFSTIDINFQLEESNQFKSLVTDIISSEGFYEGQISYVFCSDDFLLDLNIKFLHHNTLTDIITFDYTEDNTINAEIFISTNRVKENAASYNVTFINELHRVIAHGILHCCGYKDKTTSEIKIMRQKESFYISKSYLT